MKCALPDYLLKAMRTELAKAMLSHDKSKGPFDIAGYTKLIYLTNKIVMGEDTALEMATVVPSLAFQVIANTTPDQLADLMAKGINPGAIGEKIVNYRDINNVKKDVGALPVNPAEVKAVNDQLQEIKALQEKEIKLEKMFPGGPLPSTFTKSPSSKLIDRNSGDYKDTITQIYDTVKHKILDFLRKIGVGGDSRKIVMPNLTGGLHVRFMRQVDIPEAQRRAGTNLPTDLDKNTPVMLIVNENNVPILFNDKGEVDFENGKMIYYVADRKPAPTRFVKKTIDGKEVTDVTLSEEDMPFVDALTRTGVARSVAETTIKNEMKFLNTLYEHFSNSSEHLVGYFNGGSHGNPIQDRNKPTPLTQLQFDEEGFNPSTSDVNDKMLGVKNGTTYFYPSSLSNMPVEIERPKFSTEVANKIASLMVDDISRESAGKTYPLTLRERRQFISTYYYRDSSSKGVVANIDLTTEGILINNKLVDTSTPEAKVKAKEEIVKFLTSMHKIKTTSEPTEFQRKNIITSKDPMRLGASMLENDATAWKPGMLMYLIDYPKMNINKRSFYPVNLVEKDGKIYAEPAKQTFEQYILDNEFFILHEVDPGTHKLIRKNPYLRFRLNPASEEKLHKPIVKEAIKKIEDKPINKDPLKGGPQTNDFLKNRDQFLKDKKKRNKLLDQANRSVKATEEQIEEAKKWYEGHPISKYVPFATMFNMINSENSDSVAEWTVAGITLFKGSNFADLYHEAWHAFTQSFLTDEQKKKLYKEASQLKGTFVTFDGKTRKFSEASEIELEEYLAEDFRSYMLGGGKIKPQAPVRNSIFRTILDILKLLFSDLTYNEIVENSREGQFINSLYEKLRVGNLTGFTFNQENTHFSKLYSGANKLEGSTSTNNLTYEQSRTLVEAMDSLMSTFVDAWNTGLSGEEAIFLGEARTKLATKDGTPTELAALKDQVDQLNAKQTYQFTNELLKNPKLKAEAYTWIRGQFALQHNYWSEKLAEATDSQDKSDYQKKIDTLDWAVNNFGNTESINKNPKDKGLISYHHANSAFYSEEYKAEYFEGETDEEIVEKYDTPGNGRSLISMANSEVLYVLRGLHEYKDGEAVLDPLGFQKLVPFEKTWNRLARMLQNTRTLEGIAGTQGGLTSLGMIQKIQSIPSDDPMYHPMKQLLNKMGPIGTTGSNEMSLWTNFWQTFNKTNIPLIQANVKTITFETGTEGETVVIPAEQREYVITVGEGTGDHTKVINRWNSVFRSVSDSPFVIVDNKNVASLDLTGVLKTWTRTDAINNPTDFLRALGIPVTETSQMREKLTSWDGIHYIYSNLRAIDEAGMAIKSVEDIFTTPIIEGKRVSKGKIDEKGRLKTLAEWEAEYSDEFSNFMKTNAEGNTQFEHSLNNTMTVIVNTVNEVSTYDELINLPYMQFLDVKKNPMMKNSIWLESIFKKDDQGNYTSKRRVGDAKDSPFVKIELSNLSGIAMYENGQSVDNAGTATASSDEYTKILADFHLLIAKGMPELMRHADKGTAFATMVTKIFAATGNRRGSNWYVPSFEFIHTPGPINTGFEKTAELLIPKISNELERINILKEYEKTGITNYDFTYVKEGQKFQIFDDVLSPETLTKLYNLPSEITLMDYLKTEKGKTLAATLTNEITNYFLNQVEKVSKMFPEVKGEKFMAENVIQNTIIEDANNHHVWDEYGKDKKPNTDQRMALAKQAAIRSYVVNSWIHNIESLTFFYGDLALYNNQKEEFHKRNAGIASTGNLYRTDQAMINYANQELGRGYAKSLGLPSKAWDGTLDTAVLADVEVESLYYDEYMEAIEKDIRERLTDVVARITDPEKKKKKQASLESDIAEAVKEAMKPYDIKEEGNAQAWVTFDSYRILLNSEGKWTDAQEELYQDIIAGKRTIKASEVHDFFPVQKCQYWGQLKTDKLPIIGFHKYSMFPLIPTAIEGTNLQKLHEKMMGKKPDGTIDMATAVDYVTFKSGSKVSTITKDATSGLDKLYTSNDNTRIIDNSNFTKNTIYLEYLKKQLEVAPHFKGQVIFSTQLRKLIEDGLMEGGVPTDYNTKDSLETRMNSWNVIGLTEAEQKEFFEIERTGSNPFRYTALSKKRDEARVKKSARFALVLEYEKNIRELTEKKKQELLEEAGWTMGKDGKPTGSMNDLMEFVSKELKRQDLSDHEIDFIKVDQKTGKLVYDLSMSLSADKIERMLNAIVIKRLVRQKVNGEGLIQVAGSVFENTQFREKFKNATKEELKKWRGTNDLPSYHKGEDGKTVAMKVKIALQGDFEFLLQDEDVKKKAYDDGSTRLQALNKLIKEESWLNKGDNRRKVTMIGVRIPVQGLNSMEFMEIYEFLPKEAGNVIIPPSEIVAKSGSDFDVDKLTIMMPSIALVNKVPSLIKKAVVKESRQQLMESLDQLRLERKELSKKYKGEFSELVDEKYFKKLTPEEIIILEKLKKEFKESQNKVSDELDELMDKYKQFGKATPDATIQRILYLSGKLGTMYDEYKDNVRRQYMNTFREEKEKSWWKPKDEEMDVLDQNIGEIKYKLNAISTRAVENALIKNIADILALPENYVKLIRPNGTDIVKPLADDLAEDVLDYDRYETLNGPGRTFEHKGKVTKIISPTRVLEIPYNMYKHTSNNIGKQTLGLGAVDNTYNALFNRIGAYMNPSAGITTTQYKNLLEKEKNGEKLTYEENIGLSQYRRQLLLVPHNILNLGVEKAISLSHTLDADGENVISDVISQLINGWVDIAKDAWIFNIQGNKEVAPVLLFMVQAGVPFKTAVYLASQPLVRKYVEEQKKAKSTFSGPLGKSPGNPNFYRNKARKEVLFGDAGFGKFMDLTGLNTKRSSKVLYDGIVKATDQVLGEGKMFSEETLKKNIENYSKQKKEGATPEVTDYERAAFLHYLEIEDMAKAVRDIKMKMNVDTSKSATLFEAQDRILLIEMLRKDGRFPTELIDKLLTESPIGSFYIQEFQLAIWGDLFKLRNHPVFNRYLISKIRGGINQDIENTFGDPEKFINELRNGLVSYIYQNTIQSFDLRGMKAYKGFPIGEEIEIEKQRVHLLTIGAFVKEGKLYIDEKRLENDFKTRGFVGDQYRKLGLAPVNIQAFETLGQYQKFVIEREVLRSVSPYDKVKDTHEYKSYQRVFEGNISEKEENKERVLYEMWLRDKALDNVNNGWKLFMSHDSYAEQFFRIVKDYKGLRDNYAVIRSLQLSDRGPYSNLKLTDPSVDGSTLELFHENLRDLADPTVKKVEDPTENLRISQFFKKFTTVAFMQSGLNAKGSFSMIRMVPQKEYTRLMVGPVEEYIKGLNSVILDDYYQKFISQNQVSSKSDDYMPEEYSMNRIGRMRYQNYTSGMTLKESLKIKDRKIKEHKKQEVTPEWAELVDHNKYISTYGIRYTDENTGFTREQAMKLAKLHPDKLFVYNGAINENSPSNKDSFLSDKDIPNALPLIIADSFSATAPLMTSKFSDVTGGDGVKSVSETAKKAIDDSINAIATEFSTGKYTQIVFNNAGYGQYLINRDPSGNVIDSGRYNAIMDKHKAHLANKKSNPPLSKWEIIQREFFERRYEVKDKKKFGAVKPHPGEKTFLYLSDQLFNKFKWINPNSEKAPAILQKVQATQPIDDAYVLEKIKECFG